jgi:hypothetical protein
MLDNFLCCGSGAGAGGAINEDINKKGSTLALPPFQVISAGAPVRPPPCAY